jgi:hypothetical protein
MGDSPKPPLNRLTRIKPNQVLCKFLGCGKAAGFLLYEFAGGPKPAVLPFCEDHVKPVAEELGIRIPR